MESPPLTSRTPLTAEQAQLSGLAAASDGASEMAPSELALRAALEFNQLLINTMQDGFVLTDLQGIQTEANPAMCRMTGFSREEMIGTAPPHCFWPPEEYQSIWAAFNLTLQGTDESFELTFMRKNGERFPAIISPAAVRNRQGEIISYTATVKDITERKQAEMLLRERERQLSTLLGNLPGMAYRCLNDHDWTMTFASDGSLALTGYPAADLINNRTVAYADLIVPADVEMVWNEVQKGLMQKCPFCVSYRIRTAEGKEKWVWEQGMGVFAADGTLEALEGFIIDITERKLATEALKASQKELNRQNDLFTSLLKNLPIGVFMVEAPTGRPLLANDAALQLLGRGVLEGVSKENISESYETYKGNTKHPYPPEEMPILRGMSGERSHVDDMIVVRPDGTKTFLEVFGSPVADDHGQIWASLVSFADISERIHTEEKVKTQQQAIEQSATAVVITDIVGTIEYVNPAFEKASGYSAAELIGNNPRVLKSGSQNDAFYRDLWETITSGSVWRGQFHNKRKDGSLYWELATISPVINSLGEIIRFIGVKEDISELKSLEARLRLALEQAESATRAKSDFLANMSHEIRTPLNGVLGLAQMLESESLTPEQFETVQRINTSGKSLLSIINDVLDLSKIEAGRLQIDRHPFKLAQVLANVQSVIGCIAHSKGITIRTEDRSAIRGSLIGDAMRLEQVLMNLVGNAVKFTERGEVVIRVIPLGSTAETVTLRIEVQDSGIGIAPENLGELFTPFTQADFGIARRFGGTGLGLSICKRLIDSMGGQIGVESTLGTGSTFWLELAFDRVEDEVLPEHLPAPVPGPRLQGLRILVADDSEVNLFLVERLLKREGASAVLVRDGKDALECLRSQPHGYDAVLMDVQMPVMDGLAATRAIRDQLKLIDLPVIALTAGVMPEDRERAQASGLNDFLPKPLDLKLMTQVIARHCQR